MSVLEKSAESDDRKQELLDSYKAVMEVSWNFDYESNITKLQDLYTRAKDNQWNADTLDWDTVIDPSNPIMQRDNTQYSRMPFFKKLSTQQQETFTAHSTAQLLSQFLHGEQGALLTASTITHGVPDVKAKYYAATQTIDEARHVEVYDKYIKKIAIHYPMTPWLKRLIDVTLKTEDYRKIMIGMNMIVEGLALGAFNNMYRQTDEPLLKSITFNVMRDESRHVSFGHAFLTPMVKKMHADDVEDLAQFAFDGVSVLVEGQKEIDPGFLKVLETSGIGFEDFMAGMKEAEELGLVNDLPPGQVHSLKDLMIPALVRAGLITKRTKALFEGIGVPVNEDMTILNAMEDAKSDQSILNEAGASY
ncbi:MAG: ferritin-like domain-containing protein [Gammaproteobacteria bacterium]|nr:ferritin-like domain-containing protein [Gammaproteobacteria bacterium]